jgi:dimethylglycine dehydrogenase
MPEKNVPHTARVVIVGGGIMGCGLDYHLAHDGWSDVVLLEKAELTSGSTWHAAGQITHSTSSYGLVRMVDCNIDLYAHALEAETGQEVTWHGCGSFRLAYTEGEMDWLRHTLSVGRSLEINIELVGPDFIAAKHPLYNLDGVLGALWTPDDGHVDPSNVTMALAAGACAKGARIIRRCRATNITRTPSGEWLVETVRGAITCEHVVKASGTYARQMGEWSGLQLPMSGMTHHYFVTEEVPEFRDLDRELPVTRDDRLVSDYIRMEQKKGLTGIYEKEKPNSVWEDHCPWEAENELFAADYDRVMPWLEAAMDRMPAFAELGITREVHGAISHPPDGNPLVGPAPGVRNYWCACGTQIGIGWGPGLTRELARWMVHGSADISMRDYDPRRFGPYATKEWQVIKAKEDYCLRHEIPFPHFNRLAGCPIKPSPLFDRLKDKGAVHEEVYGFERPRWFARDGVAPVDHYSLRRGVVDEMVAAEVKAVRESVGITDITAFTKVRVAGPGAVAFLDRLVANRLPQKVGGVTLTHMLNRKGRIELETTIVRLAEDAFYLVCAAFFEQRLLDHLNVNRAGEDVKITSLSEDWAALALNGPRVRDVLAACTDADLSNAGFRWLKARDIDVAGHKVLALRMSYAGELGWEMHIPRENALAVYEALWDTGDAHGIAVYGSFAMNVMRLEKAFPGAGELNNEVTLPEADVMRFVKLDKEYLGVEATRPSLAEAAAGKLKSIRAYLEIELDGTDDGHGGEPVIVGGETVGSTSSMVWSPTCDKILAFAYVRPDAANPGTEFNTLIAGKPRRGRVLAGPVHDPENLRPRADG